MLPLYKIILCHILNPKSDKSCEFIKNGALVLKRSKDGYKVLEIGKEKSILPKYNAKRSIEVMDTLGKVCMPSFFDTHFHWVQDDVRLMPKKNLLQWLINYTWPYEAKFKDKGYSKDKAQKFANELVSVGTLGGACYASIHAHTADDALKYFVGDFVVGNVLMTMESPDYLTQTKKQAIALVKKQTEKFKNKYALTPRFAPTTHPDVMIESSKFAKKNKSFIQTHLSETTNEIEYVLGLYSKIKGYEKIKTYTDIYKKAKMLGPKTIMGHGIYLSDAELKTLSNTKTSIAHCPTSNAPVKQLGLGSGLFNFKKAEKYKIHWSLASDIGGGPFVSMFDVMQSFVSQNAKAKVSGATYTKALFRATVAGAQALKLSKTHGSLDSGKFANFILVNAPKNLGDKSEEVLSQIISKNKNKRASYDNMVEQTFYKGECVFIR
ncbi:amidohydrolase family protein [Halobacteriovorax sp. HLS]|uniref:amidohydrolase family protein n=1 Tax=Halobacteriovorax sp. HLS TaxID=2234000 RepID=UPI000FD849DF|nr:amidohydrolase family protein [Halobacteriovorax sp. HLS]